MANDFRVDAVWDIETADWDTFVCGALWTPENGVEVFRDEDGLADALLSLPPKSCAWAHAGGRFDVLWLLDWCRRRGTIPQASIRMSGSSIASLAIKRGPVLRDSCRLIPMGLKAACTMFKGGAHKVALELPCRCGKDCGGYCSIRVKMAAHLRRRVEEYMVQDVEALRDTMVALGRYADEHGITLAGTVASSAWATAKELCHLEDADWELYAYKMARAGYYGGRVEVARLKAAHVHRYDRASAYPAALREAIPCGKMTICDAKQARRAWARQRPGIYHATVDVPDQLAPPLPMHYGPRLVYPSGRVSGAWARDEILRAEEMGAKVVAVTDAVVWAHEKPLVRAFVEHCFGLRANAASKSLKTWLKFVSNSFTGATAQDPKQDVVVLGDYADDPAYEQVGRYNWIWKRSTFRISSRAHVHWAATLTARARIELHRQIEHAGRDWCYSDTDSVIVTRELSRNLGHKLGQWQLEGTAHDFEALAPKVYTYTDDEDDKRFARAKGIPGLVNPKTGEAREEVWQQIKNGETIIIDTGVKSLLVAARGDSIFARNDSQRTVIPREGWVGARIRVGADMTRAPTVAELEQLPA